MLKFLTLIANLCIFPCSSAKFNFIHIWDLLLSVHKFRAAISTWQIEPIFITQSPFLYLEVLCPEVCLACYKYDDSSFLSISHSFTLNTVTGHHSKWRQGARPPICYCMTLALTGHWGWVAGREWAWPWATQLSAARMTRGGPHLWAIRRQHGQPLEGWKYWSRREMGRHPKAPTIHSQPPIKLIWIQTDSHERGAGLLDLLTRTKNPKYVELENGNSVVLRIFELEGTSEMVELAHHPHFYKRGDWGSDVVSAFS